MVVHMMKLTTKDLNEIEPEVWAKKGNMDI